MTQQSPTFAGVYTALITPFQNGKVDFAELKRQVDRQVAGGVAGIVAVGTTGESPTLDTEEHLAVIGAIVEATAGRVPVLAGSGSNSTSESIHLVEESDRLGVDGHLQVAPYYNKPSQEGVFRHFAAIAEATEKPIMLYSIPGRCGIEIAVPTVKRLLEAYPHVNSIKEAGGDVGRVVALRQACGAGLTILCGDDGLTIPFMAEGAKGVVSVASNLAPAIIVDITAKALAGDFTAARAVASRYHALLTELVFIEGNPVTIKTAMREAGVLADAEMRLPLWPMSEPNVARVRAALQSIGLLPQA